MKNLHNLILFIAFFALCPANSRAASFTKGYDTLKVSTFAGPDTIGDNNIQFTLIKVGNSNLNKMLAESFVRVYVGGLLIFEGNWLDIAKKEFPDDLSFSNWKTKAADSLGLNITKLIDSTYDSAKIEILLKDGKKAIKTFIRRKNEQPNVPSILKQGAIILSYSGNLSGVFVTNEMFKQSAQAYPFNENRDDTKRRGRKRLPGEYILLYDDRSRDFYPLKKKIESYKDSDNDNKKKYREWYKLKSTRFFTIPAGSQMKVELMNYSDTTTRNIEVKYSDNFLEDEGRFKSIFSGFNNVYDSVKPSSSSGKTASSDNDGNKRVVDDDIRLLAQLRDDLVYYLSHFQFSTLTAQKHESNIQLIYANIRSKFGVAGSSPNELIASLKAALGTDARIVALIEEISGALNKVIRLKAMVFYAWKVHNSDYMNIRITDDKNRTVIQDEFRISGGWKIDFSSGVFISGLKDENYILFDTTVKYRSGLDSNNAPILRDTSGKIIIAERNSPSKLGFGIMMHAYPRIGSYVNLGLTTGISTNTNLDLNLLGGVSLMLGSNRRIVLSYGAVYGKQSKLSRVYQEGLTRTDKTDDGSKPVFYSAPSNSALLVSDWYLSWFFGLTYNFTAK